MTGVKNVNLSIRHILPVPLRFAEIERQVIPAPDHHQARLLLAHPCLPLRVGVHVGAVVEQITLNLGLAGLTQKIKLIGPDIGVVEFDIRVEWRVRVVASDSRFAPQCAFIGGAIGSKGSPRLPSRAQAFVVCDSVLHDQSLDLVRMRQGHAKTDGTAVTLHVKSVVR